MQLWIALKWHSDNGRMNHNSQSSWRIDSSSPVRPALPATAFYQGLITLIATINHDNELRKNLGSENLRNKTNRPPIPNASLNWMKRSWSAALDAGWLTATSGEQTSELPIRFIRYKLIDDLIVEAAASRAWTFHMAMPLLIISIKPGSEFACPEAAARIRTECGDGDRGWLDYSQSASQPTASCASSLLIGGQKPLPMGAPSQACVAVK